MGSMSRRVVGGAVLAGVTVPLVGMGWASAATAETSAPPDASPIPARGAPFTSSPAQQPLVVIDPARVARVGQQVPQSMQALCTGEGRVRPVGPELSRLTLVAEQLERQSAALDGAIRRGSPEVSSQAQVLREAIFDAAEGCATFVERQLGTHDYLNGAWNPDQLRTEMQGSVQAIRSAIGNKDLEALANGLAALKRQAEGQDAAIDAVGSWVVVGIAVALLGAIALNMRDANEVPSGTRSFGTR